MKKTYEELLNELSELNLYTEVELTDLEFIVNQDIYKRAQAEGYIKFKIYQYKNNLRILITKKPKEIISDELINEYYS